MSDNECGDSDVAWVPYRDRPEWKDVTPMPEDDGPKPVVVIAHSEKFEDVYGYFRAVLKNNEKSERALKLTKDAVELNPANYTVWQYRRDLLKALGTDLRSELEYVESVITLSPKNYQGLTKYFVGGLELKPDYGNRYKMWEEYIPAPGKGLSQGLLDILVWHHRKVLVEWLQDPSQELILTSDALIQDPKNYHAWQHRQWAIKTFGLYDREMDFVDNLITQDVRNNSAWNQRYFIMNNHLGWSDMNVQKEICYTMEKIKFVKNNESAWNYLRGLLLHDKRGLSGNCVVTGFCEDLYKNKCRSPFLLAFILDICDEAIKKDEIGCLHNPTRGVALCEDLANKYDKIRSKYWNYLCEKFRKAKDEQAAKLQDAEKVERTI